MALGIRTFCSQIDEKFKKNKSQHPNQKSASQSVSSNSYLKKIKTFSKFKITFNFKVIFILSLKENQNCYGWFPLPYF